jgi:hypothetical protein
MSEHKVNGGTMLLFIDPTGGTNYDTVVCLTSVGQAMSVQPVDASSACGPDKSPGAIDISYTFEGQHLQDPITGQISGTDLRLLLMAEQTVGWKLSPETPVTGDEIQEGTGYLSELSSTYAFDSVGVFTGTLQPYGVPTINIYRPGAVNFAVQIEGPEILSGGFDIYSISGSVFDVTVDWGDGNLTNYTGLNYYNTTYTYPGNDIYIITVIPSTTDINISFGPNLAAGGTQIRQFINLNAITLSQLNVVGNTINASTLDLTGLDQTVANRDLYLSQNNLSSILLPLGNTGINRFEGHLQYLTSSSVNYILDNILNYGNGPDTILLYGQTPPAPPTGQGIIDKAALIAMGWTVNTD